VAGPIVFGSIALMKEFKGVGILDAYKIVPCLQNFKNQPYILSFYGAVAL